MDIVHVGSTLPASANGGGTAMTPADQLFESGSGTTNLRGLAPGLNQIGVADEIIRAGH